jgi:hypothetical protein
MPSTVSRTLLTRTIALAALALGLASSAVTAADWNDVYSREPWAAMGVGSPHTAVASPDAEAAADMTRAAELNRWQGQFTGENSPAPAATPAVLAAWDMLYSDQPWTGMGLGQPHSPEAIAKARTLDEQIEMRHRQEIAAWSDLYSGQDGRTD